MTHLNAPYNSLFIILIIYQLVTKNKYNFLLIARRQAQSE